jgi:hypothetical protein
LAVRKLVFVSDVRRLSSGEWRIEPLDLSNERATILPVRDLPPDRAEQLPLSGSLYLTPPHEEADTGLEATRHWRLLYPLALYELERQELFLYGDSDPRKNRVGYVGTVSGEHSQKVEGKDQQRLLQRLLAIRGNQLPASALIRKKRRSPTTATISRPSPVPPWSKYVCERSRRG